MEETTNINNPTNSARICASQSIKFIALTFQIIGNEGNKYRENQRRALSMVVPIKEFQHAIIDNERIKQSDPLKQRTMISKSTSRHFPENKK